MKSKLQLFDGELVLCEQQRARVGVQREGASTVLSCFAHVLLTNVRFVALRDPSGDRFVHVPLSHLRSWEAGTPFGSRWRIRRSRDPFIKLVVFRPESIVGFQVTEHEAWLAALDANAGDGQLWR